MKGFISIVLHAHMPFVRHPESDFHIEESWFFETMLECYLPLLQMLRRMENTGVPGKLTISLSSTLLAMISDRLLLKRFEEHLERVVTLAEAEVLRRRNDPDFSITAEFYLERVLGLRAFFADDLDRSLLEEFGRLAESGRVELITTAGTHAIFPLMHLTSSRRAQVKAATDYFELLFGERPRGLWLPECGFASGVDGLLAEQGVVFSFVEGTAIRHASSTPVYGNYSPLVTPEGVAFFGRDELVRSQIWDPQGYSSDPIYRDNELDIVNELPDDEIQGFMGDDGTLIATGLKFHRITGTVKPSDKLPYNPERAAELAWEHARHFVEERAAQVSAAADRMGDRPPHITCPFDAEFFGHWWFEGPQFLEGVFHHAQKHPELVLGTPIDFLDEEPVQQQAIPSLSSWGEGGYFGTWVDDSNAWLYRHLHNAETTMRILVDDNQDARGIIARALRQAARELTLAQASDWAFIVKTGQTREYAVERVQTHLVQFQALSRQIGVQRIDEEFLGELERRNTVFPDIDWRAWSGSL